MIRRIIKSTTTNAAHRQSVSSKWPSLSRVSFQHNQLRHSAARRPTMSVSNFHRHSISRSLSTEIRAQTAAAAAANASMAAEASAGGTKGKKAESNVFLDNLGKIFLIGIGTVIATLIRSSYSTTNRHAIRDRLEEIASIDPKEFEEFREANSELDLSTMRKLLSIYYQEYATLGDSNLGYTSSYDDFVTTIRKIMATRFPEHGDAFTIQMGHYFDRIIVNILEERGEGESLGSDQLPVSLFFAAMASAMNGSVSDRIRILHEILLTEQEQHQQHSGSGMTTEGGALAKDSVPLASVRNMVGYLQETCQLPPDTQIVPTDQKIPTQQWRRATPEDMVPDTPDSKSGAEESVNLVEFAAILRTKSVCAWGECYMKWKPDASEFEPQDISTQADS